MAEYTTEKSHLMTQPPTFQYRDYGSTGDWIDFLVIQSLEKTTNTETANYTFQDVGVLIRKITNESVTISAEFAQVFDLSAIQKLTGEVYTKTVIAGTPVAGAEQTVSSGSWEFEKFILIENQNSDLSEITINSVVGSVDAGPLVEGTDYFKVKASSGNWGIAILDSVDVTTEEQDITIDYDYTPASGTHINRGGKTSIEPIEVRIKTTTPDGYEAYYQYYKVYNDGNFSHGFANAEGGEEPILAGLTFTAEKDTSRTVGDQLEDIYVANA